MIQHLLCSPHLKQRLGTPGSLESPHPQTLPETVWGEEKPAWAVRHSQSFPVLWAARWIFWKNKGCISDPCSLFALNKQHDFICLFFPSCYIPQLFFLRETEQPRGSTTDERAGGGFLALIFLAQHSCWICNWVFRNV